jgi:hypothetical protein
MARSHSLAFALEFFPVWRGTLQRVLLCEAAFGEPFVFLECFETLRWTRALG